MKEYKISGRDLGLIKYLQSKQAIMFDDEGRSSFTMDYDDVRELIKDKPKAEKRTGKKVLSISESAEAVLTGHATERAMERVSEFYKVGEIISPLFWEYAEKAGLSLRETVKTDITHILPGILDKAARFDQVEAERDGLLAERSAMILRVDPLLRLERSFMFLMRFMQEAAFCKLLNLDPTPVANDYVRLLNRYRSMEV